MSRSRVALRRIALLDRSIADLERKRDRLAAERAALVESLDLTDPSVQQWADAETAGEMAHDGLFAFEPIDPPATAGVYAIQGVGPFVKIGRADNIRERMAQLQIGQADPLGLLAVLSNDPEKERSFHRELKPWRTRGEWFRLEGEVLTMLRAYRGIQ